MPFVVQKRLIGKEDINFDANGSSDTFTITDSQGNTLQLSKLNSSHIPILTALRAKFSTATNVETALDELIELYNAIESASLTAEGLIEIADQSELEAQVDTSKAVTPAGIGLLFASAQEIADGTATNKFVSPADLASAGGGAGTWEADASLTKTTAYTITVDDAGKKIILGSGASSNTVFTLPTANLTDTMTFFFENDSVHKLTISDGTDDLFPLWNGDGVAKVTWSSSTSRWV